MRNMQILHSFSTFSSKDSSYISFGKNCIHKIQLLLWMASVTEPQHGGGWEGPLWVTQPKPPAQAGSPRAGCTAARPGGAGISPEKETPQPPWAAWARAPPPSEGRSSSSGSAGASSASVCARCPLSCCWAPLKRVWPQILQSFLDPQNVGS